MFLFQAYRPPKKTNKYFMKNLFAMYNYSGVEYLFRGSLAKYRGVSVASDNGETCVGFCTEFFSKKQSIMILNVWTSGNRYEQ